MLLLRRALLVAAALFLLLEGAGMAMALVFNSGGSDASSRAGEKTVSPRELAAQNQSLRKRLSALAPKGIYVAVDTAANRLRLMEGEKLTREAVVSCGSGNVLPDPKGGKGWVFDTPRGEFKVESKVKNPYWVRPDWAFIEEGEAIPKKYSDRIEEGVMGDYALGIGHGYFLHGTLYTRLLGRNVTHGCVRLGDEDLEALFRAVPMGGKVYIF